MRVIEVDLTGVASRDQFRAAFAPHLPLAADHAELWPSLSSALMFLPEPCRLRLVGWSGFAARMPRYAKRLRGLLAFILQLPEHSVHLDGCHPPEVEYAEPGAAPDRRGT